MTLATEREITRNVAEHGQGATAPTPWLVAAGLSAAALVGTGVSLPDSRVEDLPRGSTTGWFATPWTLSGGLVISTAISDPMTSEAGAEKLSGTAAAIREVRERAGLTWEQLARLFGVSRRSVHLWAGGGRMTAANEESLLRVAALVNSMKGSVELDVRRAVLDLLEDSRSVRASQDDDINRPPSTWSSQAGSLERG